jgi:hypothetical protein
MDPSGHQGGDSVRRALSLILAAALVAVLFSVSGCGTGDVTEASSLKSAADAVAGRIPDEYQTYESAQYSLSGTYADAVHSGTVAPQDDYASFETAARDYSSLLLNARQAYEKILALRGVEDYKAYALEMIDYVRSTLRCVALGQAMAALMNQALADIPGGTPLPATLAAEINAKREKEILFDRRAGEHYAAAYDIDSEELHAGRVQPGPATVPQHVHLTWKGEPFTTAAVIWETPRWLYEYDALVEFGTRRDGLSRVAEGTTSLRHPGDLIDNHADLQGLQPATTYYYRCGSKKYGMSEVRSFKTAPAPLVSEQKFPKGDSSYSVVLAGDTRSSSPNTSDVSHWASVAKAASTEKPLFTVLNGDLVYLGYDESLWPAWFDAAGPLLQAGPLMPSLGNHESYARGYFDRFLLPGEERWFSYDVGPVHFVCLDSGMMDYVEQPLMAEQVKWLQEDLRGAKADGSWTVVYFHKPTYDNGEEGDQPDVISEWVPTFDHFGVDIVFGSHVHYYERSFPMRGGRSLGGAPDAYSGRKGTVYLASGTGGAPTYPIEKAGWAAAVSADYGYSVMRVSGTRTLRVETKNTQGQVFDSFTLTR